MRKIVVAATGASGAIYFKLLLDKLLLVKHQFDELGILMSDNAIQVWETELGNTAHHNYPFRFYQKNDFSAPFASGSAKFDTMIVIPC
jgi:flavin prenyltransferase